MHDLVPPPVRLQADQWVDILNEFQVDGATAVFSTWSVKGECPLDIGDIEIADGVHARAGMFAPNARMANDMDTQLLAALPEGEFILKLKFLREKDDDWVLEDKFNPVRDKRKKGHGI